jgi:hypothetical protein
VLCDAEFLRRRFPAAAAAIPLALRGLPRTPAGSDNRCLFPSQERFDATHNPARRRLAVLSLAAGALCVLGSGLAQAQTPAYRAEYRLSTTLGTAFPWGQAGERWIELVKEKTQGRINIKLYSGNSLVGGDQTREFTAIRQGVIDMSIGSTINWSPQIKELNLFSLPFLMPDYKAMDALTQGEVGKELFAVLEKRDVIPLAWGENGFASCRTPSARWPPRPTEGQEVPRWARRSTTKPHRRWAPTPPR